ncbi:MAG: MarR family transcriptional regulator [Candidatus Bathyarchaeota archaeon]|nr:MarR family transcriptional regulator [Candidatus Bathyarchaeota archaeon]
MIDIITLAIVGTLLGVLAAVTTYAAIQYYKQLSRAQKEYEKARDFVEDIVLSFNRELKREAERIQTVVYKVEVNASKADAGRRIAESVEKRVGPIESQINEINAKVDAIDTAVSDISEVNAKAIKELSTVDVTGVGTKLQDIETSQETLRTKITQLEEQLQKLTSIPEGKVETPLPVMPVMPIKRDKAMASLTETEVAVLEFLSSEGPKSAPEIKEKVQLSREHTARLMKKLYEEGYLERETGKLPFKYSIKKEMEKLLRKPETAPPL